MKSTFAILLFFAFSALAQEDFATQELVRSPLEYATLLFDVEQGLTETGGGYLSWQSIGVSSVVATSTVQSGSTTNLPSIVEYDGRKTVFFRGATSGGHFRFPAVTVGPQHTLVQVYYRPTAGRISFALTVAGATGITIYFYSDNSTYIQYESGYRTASVNTNTGFFVDISSSLGPAGGNLLTFRRNYSPVAVGNHNVSALSSSLNSIGLYGTGGGQIATMYLVLCAAWDRALNADEMDALEEDIKRRVHR